jgi:hypothetical protein
VAFLLFTPLSFVIFWLGLRWPLKRAALVSVLVGLAADTVFDLLVIRR